MAHMSKITTAQLRKIYVLARERAMDDDLLHLHIQNLTHKEHIRELTVMEAIWVIDSLEGRPREPKKEPATSRQMWFMRKLLVELGWADENGEADMGRLDGFLRERFGVAHHKWLDKSKASQVIEALKAMLERQQEGVC